MAPKDWLESKEFMLAAVTNNGFALSSASGKFREDREIVLAAVTNNGFALKYASDKLKDDREIVLTAVVNNILALEYASDKLKEDREIVLSVLVRDFHSLKFVRNEAILKELAENSSFGGKKINFEVEDLICGVQKLFEGKLFDENGYEVDEIDKIANDWFDFNQIIYQNQKMDGRALLALAQVMQLRYRPFPKNKDARGYVEKYTRKLLIEAIELNDEWLIDIIHRGFIVDEYFDYSDLADKASELLWNRREKNYENALIVLRDESMQRTTGLTNEFALKVIQEAREFNIGVDFDKKDFENFVSKNDFE